MGSVLVVQSDKKRVLEAQCSIRSNIES